MTTILCDGEYIVADKRSTCTRVVNNNYAEGVTNNNSYRFVVDDTNKIAKLKGVKINGKVVMAVALAGLAAEAADFLRDLREYVSTHTPAKDQHVDLKAFLKVRAVFKVPFSGSFSLLFLTEGKEATTIRVSASSKKHRRADGVAYQTEVHRIKHYDFSETGKDKGCIIGIGSGAGFYDELKCFIRKNTPHILDTFVYCVNRDHEHSSRNFSVFSLELNHLDSKVEMTYEDFEERLKRFVSQIDLTIQPLGSLPIAVLVSPED